METEAAWVRQIRDGDEKAFERLFRAYCPRLVQFVCRYVGDRAVAEGLVQDVFLAVWADRRRLQADKNIKTYLYTAAKNRALKHLRHGAVQRQSAAEVALAFPHPKTPEDERRQHELEKAICQAVDALPEQCRILFCMNRYDRLTYAEIAAIQGISLKTVETQMGRALKALRQRLAALL